ncbi:MAG: hypothetical protein EOO24_09165 [Comamonadaceae bacterium]|nr:MAG: hypothetical protein EOO24_09165 [Comamonadaceae bacterium]
MAAPTARIAEVQRQADRRRDIGRRVVGRPAVDRRRIDVGGRRRRVHPRRRNRGRTRSAGAHDHARLRRDVVRRGAAVVGQRGVGIGRNRAGGHAHRADLHRHRRSRRLGGAGVVAAAGEFVGDVVADGLGAPALRRVHLLDDRNAGNHAGFVDRLLLRLRHGRGGQAEEQDARCGCFVHVCHRWLLD